MNNNSILSAEEVLIKKELFHAKMGVFWSLFAGVAWGLDGVLLGIMLILVPFTDELVFFMAPLVGACLHDGFAAFWVFLFNLISGKWREYIRTLATRPGQIVCCGALLGGPIAMSGYLLGIKFAGASYALSITAMYPAVGAILAVFILKEKITFRAWIGIATCIIGALVVSWTPPPGNNYPHFYLGLGLSLIPMFGWALEGVLGAYAMDMVDPSIAVGIREATSFVIYFVAVLPVIAGFTLFKDVFVSGISSNLLYILIFSGLVGGIAYLGWYKAINMTGVGRAMAINITYALWSIIFAVILTDFQITLSLIIGAVIITVGSILVIANPKELADLRSK